MSEEFFPVQLESPDFWCKAGHRHKTQSFALHRPRQPPDLKVRSALLAYVRITVADTN